MRAIIRAIASVPEVRDFLIEIRHRQKRQERQVARIAQQAIMDIILYSPDLNNPLIAYLLATITNGQKMQKSADQSIPKENNQIGPSPVSAPRR